MLLNQTSEYALRAMALLATTDGGPMRSEQLSEQAGIPIHYVSKVMRRLVVAGLVSSKRGRGGGFQLARPAASIRLLDVLEATDVVLQGGRCAFGTGDCDISAPCALHPVWTKLKDDLLKWATLNTLDDLS